MPLFEYHCQTCDQTLEVLQRDARVLETCGDDCVCGDGEGALVRKISAHAVLRGGGALSMSDMAPATCGSCGMAPGSCGES
jgi:hypothetical protein